ncbi:tetratricopeptide repeat protein [candidate division KSB1 bacterium]|nr:tetratricopeptide repeat protein [candidate division KSB1 bacterium]
MTRRKQKARPQKHAAPAHLQTKKQVDKRKRRLFTILMILIPVLFLLLLEMGLRLFHYGGEWDLVLKRSVQGHEFYTINRQVARRYFIGDDISVPEANGEVFSFIKSSNTVRIFCLGESSTAGWPFQFNGTFPSQLQSRLALLFPEREFEVINVGISAISSYSVLDFTRELVDYQPDLFLVYMGHNEFYGALGAASTQSMGGSRAVIQFYLSLEKLRLFQLLRDVVGLFRSGREAADHSRTLMEKMIGERIIPPGTPIYDRARSHFEANLTDMLRIIQERDVPVLVGTLVSNLAGQPPFESIFPSGFNRQVEWKMLSDGGDAAAREGNYSAAIQAYTSARHLSDYPAMLWYKLGVSHQGMGRFDLALDCFLRARDQDVLRFRAPGEFNQIIRRVCSDENVPVVEIENTFSDHSTDGLIGNELLFEHVHPNVRGYFLMAHAFCRAMAEHDVIVPAAEWPWHRDLAAEELIRRAYVTELDMEIASLRILQLTSRYPFKQPRRMVVTTDSAYAQALTETAQSILRREISWNDGHYRIADYLGKRGLFAAAEREYRAVIRVMPGNYYPYIFLANTLIERQKMEEAEEVLLQALRFSPYLPFAYAKLGVLYVGRNDAQKAKPFLENAIKLAPNSSEFSRDDLAYVHYLLAVVLAQLDELAEAKKEVEIALRVKPQEQRFLKLQAQILTAMEGN